MLRFALVCGVLFSGVAFAAGDDICVRNYLGGDPDVDVCERLGGRYVYVQPKEGTGEAALCAITYPEAACSQLPREYRKVRKEDGSSVCVVDFNQPGVGNYCETTPDLYGYAQPYTE